MDTDSTSCARSKNKPGVSLLHPTEMDRDGILANSPVSISATQIKLVMMALLLHYDIGYPNDRPTDRRILCWERKDPESYAADGVEEIRLSPVFVSKVVL